MRLLSVNVGRPRTVLWHGRGVSTAIFKRPVAGPVALGRLDLEGDEQADLSVHGGPDKAVYVYPSEHYDLWRSEMPGLDLSGWGAFGENWTTVGLREDEVAIGDRFRVGTAEVRVTQPRMPCFKLGIRFGDDGMVERFLRSERTGFYVSVLREGVVAAGDVFERIASRLDGKGQSVTVAEVFGLYTGSLDDPAVLARAAAAELLPDGWRRHFRQQLARAGA